MILISHDLGVVAGVADRVLVMYAGKAVEVGRADDVFAGPGCRTPAGLLASLPSLDRAQRAAAVHPWDAAVWHRLRAGLRLRSAVPDRGARRARSSPRW